MVPSGSKKGLIAILVAAVLCICSVPVIAYPLILRCDSPSDALSFSVLLDPSKRLVLGIGFGSNIETEQFSETVIAASYKDSAINQRLIIDRITGQFQLSSTPSNVGDKGGNYQGACRVARSQF